MKNIYSCMLSLLLIQPCFLSGIQAQVPVITTGNMAGMGQWLDMSGKPVLQKTEYDAEGSPYYPQEYYKATVFIKNGKTYSNIYVKLNLYENLVLYKEPDGTELAATVTIQRIVFTDTASNIYNMVFENGFPSAGKQNDGSYYQVLDSGKTKLLKYYWVDLSDIKGYGEASVKRVFEQKQFYYLLLGGKMTKLEKGQEALLSILTDKKEEIKKYIEKQKIKCRSEDDWKKVIAYYNSF